MAENSQPPAEEKAEAPAPIFGAEAEAPAEEKKEEVKPDATVASASKAEGEATARATAAEESLKTSTDLHTTKDENIVKMAAKIKNLEEAARNAPPVAEDKPGEVDLPHKDIKYSKDLTAEKREELTTEEIAQMDTISKLQDDANKAATDAASKATEKPAVEEKKEEEEEGGVQTIVPDLNQTVREKALELGGQNTEAANKIIEAYKAGNFNSEGLTPEAIQAQVAMAASGVEGLTVVKKDTTPPAPGGGAPAGGDANVADPHNVDQHITKASETAGDKPYEL